MSVISLTYAVKRGAFAIQDRMNLPFGTGNLNGCVGIIATLSDNSHFCAHLDVRQEPGNQSERDQLSQAVESWLTWVIPLANVTSMWYSSSGSLASTFCMIAGIKAACPGAQGHNRPTLYFSEGGEMVANDHMIKCGKFVAGTCTF